MARVRCALIVSEYKNGDEENAIRGRLGFTFGDALVCRPNACFSEGLKYEEIILVNGASLGEVNFAMFCKHKLTVDGHIYEIELE